MSDETVRLGVCSWSLLPESPKQLADAVRVLGLSKIQLAIDPVAESSAWTEAGAVLSGEGIEIASGMYHTIGEDYTTLETIRRTGGVVPDEHWERNIENARRDANIAAELGVKLVSSHAGFIPPGPDDPTRDILIERVAMIADVFAEECDGVLLLETGQETAETLEGFLGDLDRANVGVNFDPANMILYGMGDPVDAARRLVGGIRQVHLKDACSAERPGQEWGAEVPVGAGEVDWPAFFSVLGAGGFSGDMMFEREAGDDRPGDIATGIGFIKGVMSS